MQLLDSNNQLEKKKSELEVKNEEITVQNEEILLANEEISAQRDFIESKNKELEKLSIVASETDNAILIMDKYGNFEWANHGFEKLYGYKLDEYIKIRGNNIFEASTNNDIKEIIITCFDIKQSISYNSNAYKRDGSEIWLQTTLTPILDSDNEISKLVAIDADITKIKEAEIEIKKQRDLLKLKNDLINGSINYAKNIQNAILPSIELIKQNFDFMAFYKPKDIVSGDFYWYANTSEYHFFACVDCTGHGVPGAFMSMIGSRLLNELIIEQKIHSTKDALEQLDLRVKEALRQKETENTDGMDIGLCRIKKNKTNTELMFTGAKIDLFYIDNNELKTLKGERKTIGGNFDSKNTEVFTNQFLRFNKNSIIYMSTDGIFDQNNNKRKRFGKRRFKNLLLNNYQKTLTEQYTVIENALSEWKGKDKQRDDITVIAIKTN